MYSHPDVSGSLRSTEKERNSGKYPLYHKLNGYIVTFLANGDENRARFRLRKNPGFDLLQEKFDYECRAGKTYHIKIVKDETNIQYWVDGNKIIDYSEEDNAAGFSEGMFGFRTWHTTLWWDNLVIKQLP